MISAILLNRIHQLLFKLCEAQTLVWCRIIDNFLGKAVLSLLERQLWHVLLSVKIRTERKILRHSALLILIIRQSVLRQAVGNVRIIDQVGSHGNALTVVAF